MKSIYNNLTIFFVAYHSDYSFEKLIKKINKKIKIIIIENSNLSETKIYFEKKYKNVKVILSSKNGGQTGGFNLGLKNIKTKYALYLDMDVNFDNSIIKNFYDSAEKIKDFIILAPEHHKSGYPIKFIHELNKINDVKTRMRIIHGHFMFFNMNNVKKVGLFDKKIFMYYEETDYCTELKKQGLEIIYEPRCLVHHFEFGSAALSSHAFDMMNRRVARNWMKEHFPEYREVKNDNKDG